LKKLMLAGLVIVLGFASVFALAETQGDVTLGDLALEQDRDSALADVSGAPPNV
jgi:hypothetical protein